MSALALVIGLESEPESKPEAKSCEARTNSFDTDPDTDKSIVMVNSYLYFCMKKGRVMYFQP